MNASQLIDQRIAELNDWRGEKTAQIRKLIHEVCPDIKEGWKWGSPIFANKSLILSIGSFKDHIKIHFFQGANLKDPNKLFNSGLDAKKMRGIDFFENDQIDEEPLKELILEAYKFDKDNS